MELLNSGKPGYELLMEYPLLKTLAKSAMKKEVRVTSDDSSEDDDVETDTFNPDLLQSVLLAKCYLCSLSVEKLITAPPPPDDRPRYANLKTYISAPARISRTELRSPKGADPIIKRRLDDDERKLNDDLRTLKKRTQNDERSGSAGLSPSPTGRSSATAFDLTTSKEDVNLDPVVTSSNSMARRLQRRPSDMAVDLVTSLDSSISTISLNSPRSNKVPSIAEANDSPILSLSPPSLVQSVSSPHKNNMPGRSFSDGVGVGSPLRSSLRPSNRTDRESSPAASRAPKKKAASALERHTPDYLAREVKREALLELVAFVKSDGLSLLPDQSASYRAALDMVRKNLFRRAIPPSLGTRPAEADSDDDSPILDPRWPHVSVVHEFLGQLLNTKAFPKSAVDATFCSELVAMFRTEDPRERESFKMHLHKIYGMLPAMRPAVRKEMQMTFETVVNERQKHAGLHELLEMLGSVVSGFSTPLKKEHFDFLRTALIPLHRADAFARFHNQLCYCVSQYVEKDPTTIVLVVRALRKYFPHHAAAKQILFLDELEETLEIALRSDQTLLSTRSLRKLLPEAELIGMLDEAASVVEDCLSCEHFQVVERALFLWNNDYLAHHLFKSSAARMLGIFQAVERDRYHWNPTVRRLAEEVAQLYAGDQNFEDCASSSSGASGGSFTDRSKRRDKQERERMWEEIAQAASRNSQLGRQ